MKDKRENLLNGIVVVNLVKDSILDLVYIIVEILLHAQGVLLASSPIPSSFFVSSAWNTRRATSDSHSDQILKA